MLLNAGGHSQGWFNGTPVGGDVYSYGWLSVPVMTERGKNEFLANVGRGRVKASLTEPPADLVVHQADATLPDFVIGEQGSELASFVVLNCTNQTQTARLKVSMGSQSELSEPFSIAPLAARQPGIKLPRPTSDGEHEIRVSVVGHEAGGKTFKVRTKTPRQMHKRTFRSEIDGSVQYYAVQPSSQDHKAGEQALILSVHGASVEATNQANAYGSKPWGTLAAATNRRPYGFDWEDWGRKDALEVLADAKRRYQPDDQRIYLTGHSMGGHGTWHLGAMHPDKWAGIAPAAGWISFASYGRGPGLDGESGVAEIMRRASTPSDTLQMIQNYKQHAVYILHGDADRTVSVDQAKEMHQRLSEFHPSLQMFLEPGGGHWYDTDPDPGANCVDHPPLWEFLTKHRRKQPSEAKTVAFTTPSPGVTSSNHWVEILQQIWFGQVSKVNLTQRQALRRIEGTTENVMSLRLDLSHWSADDTVALTIDDQELKDVPYQRQVTLTKEGTKWMVGSPPATEKRPDRYGSFREVFDNRFVLVYGTAGDDAADRWTLSKARQDALNWWYRGNGDTELIADRDFSPSGYAGRNVILYGGPGDNTAFSALIDEEGGTGLITDELKPGSNAATLFTYPRKDDPTAMVGVIAATGETARKTTEHLNYFLAGVHYPDFFIYEPEMLTMGMEGVIAAGWFHHDWTIEGAQMAWRQR